MTASLQNKINLILTNRMGVGICVTDNPHCLQWSPFQENLLAVSTSNRPGHTPISGILYFLEFLPENDLEIAHQVQLNIGTDKMAWSHQNKNILIASCDDFMLRFFDLKNPSCMYREFFEKSKVRNLDCDRISLEYILTAGGDDNVRVYNTLQEEDEAIQTITHKSGVHDAQWSKDEPFTLSSCDRDGFVYLWNIQEKDAKLMWKCTNDTIAMKIDVNNFDSTSIAVAGFDQSIYTYDTRHPSKPKGCIKDAHNSLITNIKWSPHTQHILATSSCDRTLRIWDMRPSPHQETNDTYGGGMSSLKSQKMEDWVNDLDWNPHEVGLLGLCCNDHLVKAYNCRED
jgi:WD40 repeat protein